MKLTKCDAGHYYDSDKYPECPYCNTELQKQGGAGIVQGGAAAAPIGSPAGPVTGWLVVTKGPGRGKDLRLGEGRTVLGVNAAGEPATLSADAPLGVRQATLAYDPADGSFTLLPGSSQELCYLAGKSVLEPSKLTGGEELSLGKATLQFVPFCGSFKWN